MNKSALISILFLFLVAASVMAQREIKQNTIEIQKIKFGEIKINNKTYDHDIVIENGELRKRDKGPSKAHKNGGHTPLSIHEAIPWDCKILVIGKGMSNRLPIWNQVKEEAEKRGIELIILKTPDAVDYINKNYSENMNAVLHITC